MGIPTFNRPYNNNRMYCIRLCRVITKAAKSFESAVCAADFFGKVKTGLVGLHARLSMTNSSPLDIFFPNKVCE